MTSGAGDPPIVHVTPLMFGDDGVWGGGERYALELATAQSRQRKTRLIGFGRRPRREFVDDLEVVVLPARGHYRHPLNPLSLSVFHQLGEAEVVHVHQLETLLTDALLLEGRRRNRRVFVTDLGGSAPRFPRRFRREPMIAGVLALSQYSADFYPSLAAKTTVIYGGADLEKFRPSGRPRRGIVYVGRLVPHKGIDVLIDAVADGMSLTLYGRAYDATYRDLLERKAAGKDVRFVEDGSDAEIVAAYQSARVSVLASVPHSPYGQAGAKSELLGLVVIEAMACGTPVVCSDFGPLPEICLDGETGFVVPAGDPVQLRRRLRALLDDDQLWTTLSAAAHQRATTQFNWATVAAKALAVYDAGADH